MIFGKEPAMIYAAVNAAVISVLSIFVDLDPNVETAIGVVVALVVGWLTRSVVTPVAKLTAAK